MTRGLPNIRRLAYECAELSAKPDAHSALLRDKLGELAEAVPLLVDAVEAGRRLPVTVYEAKGVV